MIKLKSWQFVYPNCVELCFAQLSDGKVALFTKNEYGFVKLHEIFKLNIRQKIRFSFVRYFHDKIMCCI